MSSVLDNRKPTNGQVFLFGAALGAGCFLLAEWLVPREVNGPGGHDLLLANRLGFIYPPLLGAWLGWLQRSWPRALLGVVLGILIGILYYLLCGWNFFAVMVAFPCLLGGVFAMILESSSVSFARCAQVFRGGYPTSCSSLGNTLYRA
jgi:hypothetical protein